MTDFAALLADLCGRSDSVVEYLRRVRYAGPVTVEDGLLIDTSTGIVLGTYLELDRNHNGYFSPIYCYNRSWRFSALFSLYDIDICDQNRCLCCFEALESVWEKVKKDYSRTYFLSQKLILQQICSRLTINSTQPPRRPIADLRRYNAQMVIFNDLWKKL